jgi:hypothetical protein
MRLPFAALPALLLASSTRTNDPRQWRDGPRACDLHDRHRNDRAHCGRDLHRANLEEMNMTKLIASLLVVIALNGPASTIFARAETISLRDHYRR